MRKIKIENEKNNLNPDLEIDIKNFHRIGGWQYNVLPLSSFRYHHLIYGKHKESLQLFQDISKQLYTNAPTLGQLIINTSLHFNFEGWIYDKRYDFDTLTFPYHSGSILSDSVKDIVITFIIGLFGFWDEVYDTLAIVFKEREKSEFPSSLIELLRDLKQSLKKYPYSARKTTKECRKIGQGIKFLLLHPRLQKALLGSNNSNSTQWIEEWKNGDTLYIDLTNENKEMQSIIIAAMSNYICQMIPHSNAQIPSGIIILDEIPYFLRDSSEKYLFRFQLTEWFIKIVRDELRYRNIGILSNAVPSNTITQSMENACHRIVKY